MALPGDRELVIILALVALWLLCTVRILHGMATV